MARIELANRSDLPPEQSDLIDSLSAKKGLPEEYHHLIEGPERNIYRAMGRIPSVLEPFRTFGSEVWEACGVDPRRRELVILTVAAEFEAAYEWHQHVRVGLKAGLTPAEIRNIGAGDDEAFLADDRVLMRYIRLYLRREVDEETFETFVDTYGEPAAVGVGLLGGIYVMVAMFADVLELETEEPFVGWDLAGL